MEALGTPKQGLYGVTDIFVDQRKYDKDASKQFIWRERGFAQLAQVLITALPKVAVSDMEPKHFEDGYRVMDIPLTGLSIASASGSAPETVAITFTTGGTTPATDVSNFQVGQVWENEKIFMSPTYTTTFSSTWSATRYATTEKMLVTAVDTSSGVVTFRRHLGTGTRQGTTVELATTDILHLHSIKSADNAGAPTSFSQGPVTVNNYCEIMKEPYEIGDVAAATSIFGENEWQRKARNARRNFARQIERAYLSGTMYYIDTTEGRQWFTGGVDEWFPLDTTHRIALAKTPTATMLNSTLKAVFMTGSSEKWGFCGYGAMTKIGNAFADGLRHNDSLSTFIGLEVSDIKISAGGTLHLIPDYEMSQMAQDNEVKILDTAYLRYMYLQGHDIQIDKGKTGVGLQGTDKPITKHQIIAHVGLKRTFRDSHFQLRDLR